MKNMRQKTENNELILSPLKSQEAAFKTCLYKTDSQAKRELEQFVSLIFAQHYNAKLLHFLPNLFGAYDEQQRPYAAVGYRVASEQRLFLEQYLDDSVEMTLHQLQGQMSGDNNNRHVEQNQPLQRKHIVEIGNLATAQRGACQKFFQLLTLYFHHSQFRWIVFTATRTVRTVIKQMQLEAYLLTSAHSADIVQEEREGWGSYYQQRPTVMAMPVAQNISAIAECYTLGETENSMFHF